MRTWELLKDVGFEQIDEGKLRWEFDNCALSACESFCVENGYAIFLSGVVTSRRAIGSIDYPLPRTVESVEQGLAFLAYACRDHHPEPASWWLIEGREHQGHLPWEKQRRAYQARPHCVIGREWFRLAAKELRAAAETATSEQRVVFFFDGAALRIEWSGKTMALPGSGEAWMTPVAVESSSMTALPKRLARDPVWVDVWENRLGLAGIAFLIADPATKKGD